MKRTSRAVMALASLLLAAFPAAAQYQLDPAWSLAPGSRSYLTTNNTQRGLAYNPVTRHVLVVNRDGGNSINILDGATGANVGTLPIDGTLIAGGTFAVNMIGVADDGAIFVGNLTVNATTTNFRLYRWANETASPTLAFSGTPAPGKADSANNALRFGDVMDVRGAGASTQVMLSSRGTNMVSLLTTADGNSFSAAVLQADATWAAGNNGPFGLGLAFGAGDTFWGKSGASGTVETPLRELSFDAGAGTATTLLTAGNPTVSIDIRNLGFDPAMSLLAGINNVNHSLQLFDVSGGTPVLLDTEFFPTANANGNGTGAADFGGGMLFALDSNNGIIAFNVVPEPGTLGLLALALAACWHFRSRKG